MYQPNEDITQSLRSHVSSKSYGSTSKHENLESSQNYSRKVIGAVTINNDRKKSQRLRSLDTFRG